MSNINMTFPDNYKYPSVCAVSFVDVTDDMVVCDVGDYGSFAVVTIRIGMTDVTMHTDSVESAERIVSNIARASTFAKVKV